MKNKSKPAQVPCENHLAKKPLHKKLDEKAAHPQQKRTFGVDLTHLHANQTELAIPLTKPLAPKPLVPPEREYRPAIINYLRRTQVLRKPTQSRFSISQGQIRTAILPRQRCELVLAILFIGYQFDLRRDTIFMSVYLMDRCFNELVLKKDQIQTYLFACLFIAMKFEEIYPPRLSELVTEGNTKDIIIAEGDILKLVGFDLTFEGPAKYLQMWGEMLGMQPKDIEGIGIVPELFLLNEAWATFSAEHIALASIDYFGKLTDRDYVKQKLVNLAAAVDYQACLNHMARSLTANFQYIRKARSYYSSEQWMRLFNDGVSK